MNPWAVVLAIVAGGVASVERKAVGQFMLARPIVVAPIIAALLGRTRAGFALGVPMELAFLATTSFGASTPYHESLAAMFAAAFAATALHVDHAAASLTLPIAFFAGLPFALIGRWAEAALERRNVHLIDQAEHILAGGHPGRATRHVLIGLGGTFALGASVTLLGSLSGLVLGRLEPALPAAIARGLLHAWPLVLGTSAALAVRAIQIPRGALLSAAAAAAVFVVWGLSELALR